MASSSARLSLRNGKFSEIFDYIRWKLRRAYSVATREAAVSLSPEEWQAETQGPDHQVFGLFEGNRLIGITAVFTYGGDPTGQTAVLAMSFILPQYRGHGLSRMLYDARLAWIRAQPKFKRVLVSHRKSNEASRRANQRHGFVQTKIAPRTWPDGETDDEVFYELEISASTDTWRDVTERNRPVSLKFGVM